MEQPGSAFIMEEGLDGERSVDYDIDDDQDDDDDDTNRAKWVTFTMVEGLERSVEACFC